MTIFLHGFWGAPQDWNPVIAQLPLAEPLWIPDLYASGELSPQHDLPTWRENFCQKVAEQAMGQPVQLVGYSMGARLALEALKTQPSLFSRTLLLSGAPFLFEQTGAERRHWEEQWTQRFLNEEWESLEKSWQDQPVFMAGPITEGISRRREGFMREALGLSLKQWSPGHQQASSEELRALPAAVEWAFGALDQKYVRLAKILRELPVQGQISLIPNAGHQLISVASAWIAQWIQREAKGAR